MGVVGRRARCSVIVSCALLVLGACGHTRQYHAVTVSDRSVGGPAPSGDQFTDPQGTYTMTVAAGWTRLSGTLAAEIEAWQVLRASNGFAANVNVLTQDVPSTMSLQQYLDTSARQAPRVLTDFRLISADTVTNATGEPVGRFEYTATTVGKRLHFLAIVSVHGSHAVVATLTGPEAQFDVVRSAVEPYLLTLHAT